MVEINEAAPDFRVKAFMNNDFVDVKLEDYRGKWVVLFFYPGDFTFVCPTELGALADSYAKFNELGAEILSVSTDSEFVHKAWYDNSEMIKKIKFPMLADPTGNLCKDYGVYIEEEGVALRGTFLIDPDGVLKAMEIHNNDIGRDVSELIRKIEAAEFVKNNPGNVCPANWTAGSQTLKPGIDLVGKI